MRDAQPVITAKNKLKATGSYLANFYARRIKRLIPAASVTLLFTLGLVYLSGNLSLIQETAKQITASALFYQNWFLANSSVDYLSNTEPTAVQHFWSLSLEEQFYLVWPLLLLVTLLVTSSLYIAYKKKEVVSLAIIPVILLIAGFFAYGYYLTQTEPSLAYFVTPARVWELLLGGLVAFLPLLKNYDLRLLLPWIGFTMIGYSLYKWGGMDFPGWHAMVPTFGTALIIYAGGMAGDSKWSFENIFRYKPIQWLGNLSYSLYLWHWPLIILLPVLFFIDIDAHPQSLFIKLGILALSLIAAQLSYRYVEQTTQRIEVKKRYIYISFIAITALVAGLAFFASNQVEANVQNSVQETRKRALDDGDRCFGAKSTVNGCQKSYGYIEDDYTQIASSDRYAYLLNYNETCSSYDAKNSSKSKRETYCEVGDLKAEQEITIWGDSHAQHWINPMDKIGLKNNIKVNIIGTSSCLGQPKPPKNCDIRFDSIKNSGVLNRSEAIIVSMWHSRNITTKGNYALSAFKELGTMTTNRNVYFLEDIPRSGDEGGPNCNALRLSCKNDIQDATSAITKNSADLIEMGIIRADRIITVKDMFCDNAYCYSNIGGTHVYRDKKSGANDSNFNSHLTASFAYSTWPALEKKLKDMAIIK